MKAVVERMCIACRERMPKEKMLRIVKNKEGIISLDFSKKMSGRGAYICDDPKCVTKCCKAKLLSKVFEQPVAQEIYEAIEKQYADKQDR